MRPHGVKAMGGHLLKTEMLLDTFMKKLHGPTHPVPCHNLACGGPQIIAGKILAATIRSVTLFGTHQTRPCPHSASSPRCVGREDPFAWVCCHSSPDEWCST